MFGGGSGPMRSGGGMLRAAGRAMTTTGVANGGGIQDPFTSSSSSVAGNAAAATASHGGGAGSASRQAKKPTSSSGSNNLTISAPGSPMNLLVSANSGRVGGAFACVGSGVYDEFEWVSVEGSDDEFVFGSVPSVDEVQDAVSALQQVFEGTSYPELVRDRFECNFNKDAANWIPSPRGKVRHVSSFGSDLDWMEPTMQLCNPRMLHTRHDPVYNAFHLLQTEPSVQRMVVSLSSDKAIWDAVMNNEVVREIRELYTTAADQEKEEESSNEKTPGGTSQATDFIKWVLNNTKAKAMEVFEKITRVVTEFFNIDNVDEDKAKEYGTDGQFEKKLRTSVFLSIVVLLVVVVCRASQRT